MGEVEIDTIRCLIWGHFEYIILLKVSIIVFNLSKGFCTNRRIWKVAMTTRRVKLKQNFSSLKLLWDKWIFTTVLLQILTKVLLK